MKIAFYGHKEYTFFDDKDYVKRRIDDMCVVLKRQYKEDDLIFLLGGNPGVHLWIGEKAIQYGVKYKLYLPCFQNIFSQYWKDEQANELCKQYNSHLCVGTYIGGYKSEPSCSICSLQTIKERRDKMIEDCNILFVFWLGKKRGETYEAIKTAIKLRKQVFNAYEEIIVQLNESDI